MQLSFIQPQSSTSSGMSLRHARSQKHLRSLVVPIPALIVSWGVSAICYWQASATLGLFLGPLILATLYVPPLILSENGCVARLSVLVAVIIGPTLVWLSVGNKQVINPHQLLQCMLVMAGWVSAVSGGTLILRELRVVPILASTVTIIASLFWLTWPIWLSPILASHRHAVGWLSWDHPIMAMNSVVQHLGLWGSPMGGSDLAYRYLTILNQDVAYSHSQSIWPFVLVHECIGVPLMSAAFLLARIRVKPRG